MKKSYIIQLKQDIDNVINSAESSLSESEKVKLIEISINLGEAIKDKNITENILKWTPLVLNAVKIFIEYFKSPPV